MFTAVNTLSPASPTLATDLGSFSDAHQHPEDGHLLGVPTGSGGPVRTPNTAPIGWESTVLPRCNDCRDHEAPRVRGRSSTGSVNTRTATLYVTRPVRCSGEVRHGGSAALPNWIRRRGRVYLEFAEVYRGKPPLQNMAWRESKTSATRAFSAKDPESRSNSVGFVQGINTPDQKAS